MIIMVRKQGLKATAEIYLDNQRYYRRSTEEEKERWWLQSKERKPEQQQMAALFHLAVQIRMKSFKISIVKIYRMSTLNMRKLIWISFNSNKSNLLNWEVIMIKSQWHQRCQSHRGKRSRSCKREILMCICTKANLIFRATKPARGARLDAWGKGHWVLWVDKTQTAIEAIIAKLGWQVWGWCTICTRVILQAWYICKTASRIRSSPLKGPLEVQNQFLTATRVTWPRRVQFRHFKKWAKNMLQNRRSCKAMWNREEDRSPSPSSYHQNSWTTAAEQILHASLEINSQNKQVKTSTSPNS